MLLQSNLLQHMFLFMLTLGVVQSIVDTGKDSPWASTSTVVFLYSCYANRIFYRYRTVWRNGRKAVETNSASIASW